MAYRVVNTFYDLADMHKYWVGDSYPRDGAAVSDSHIQSLLSDKNHMRKPVIVKETKRRKKGE